MSLSSYSLAETDNTRHRLRSIRYETLRDFKKNKKFPKIKYHPFMSLSGSIYTKLQKFKF